VSGSLAKFWQNPDIISPPEDIPDLLTPELRTRLQVGEERRISVRTHSESLNCAELSHFVLEKPGPRLVILNTVQSAAVLANLMRANGQHVMHLSTALTPSDRARMVGQIWARLSDRDHTDWTLAATSCVEAGVDFSFRTAVRESCSVASLIQTGGRVNRHGTWASAEVWDVRLQDPMFNANPDFDAPRRVLAEMLLEGKIGPDISGTITEALRRELVLKDAREKSERLRKWEAVEEFPEVAQLYRVIDSNTRTVVVDRSLARKLENGERVSWRELLKGSVQIWAKKLDMLSVRQFDHFDELYHWTSVYDPDFLGYMAGILPLIHGWDTGLHA